jgi:hypothetical protein
MPFANLKIPAGSLTAEQSWCRRARPQQQFQRELR